MPEGGSPPIWSPPPPAESFPTRLHLELGLSRGTRRRGFGVITFCQGRFAPGLLRGSLPFILRQSHLGFSQSPSVGGYNGPRGKGVGSWSTQYNPEELLGD
jgi:hypothetical protein